MPGPVAKVEQKRSKPRKRLPAPERRRVILDAALGMFAAHGYEGAGMDAIAAAAGVSKAVLYDHVSSKRELYDVLLESIRRELVAVVEEALQPDGNMTEARVRVAADALYRYVEEHPNACRMLFLELKRPEVSPLGRALEERLTTTLADTLGTDPGILDRQPDRHRHLVILAELIKSSILGLASWWFLHADIPRAELVDRTAAFVWPSIERARADGRGADGASPAGA